MKFNTIIFSTVLAVTSIFTVSAHADNSTRIAATSALGSVVGTAVGKQIGGKHWRNDWFSSGRCRWCCSINQ